MLGWRDKELKQDRFAGRDDSECWKYDRDWRYLLSQKVLNNSDRDELHRVLAENYLSEADVQMIKHALKDETDND